MLVPTTLLPSIALLAALSSAAEPEVWREADLRPHTDGDSILIAINGTVYDVSGSPKFYGPGGPYHHFTGRDASRGWVTECWDEEDQLTWRMDGVEEMFMPKYLDETMDDLAAGKDVEGMEDVAALGMAKEQIVSVAKMSVQKTGGVSKKKRAQRREEDLVEARQKAHDALKHWIDFFEGKYAVVGTVEYDEAGTPAPPAICDKALKKRPIKGGKLESLMGSVSSLMGEAGAAGKEGEGMPDFVKERREQVKDADNVEDADGRDEL